MSDNERAQFLNEYFSTVCTTDDEKSPPFDQVVPDDVLFDSVSFAPEKVLAAIKKVKRNKASGSDIIFWSIEILQPPWPLLYHSFLHPLSPLLDARHCNTRVQKRRRFKRRKLQTYFFSLCHKQANGDNYCYRYALFST